MFYMYKMKNMSTFTSTLPDQLLAQLADYAKRLSIPKNKLIEKALRIYLEQLERAEYTKSYKMMSEDTDLMLVAEEGMAEYLKQIEE